jgi:hypothetical protein
MHLFWSSHVKKRACMRLSMGGGHGRVEASLRAHGELTEEGKEGEGEERGGGGAGVGHHGEGEGCRRGRHGGSACCSGLLRSTCAVRENRKQEGEEEKEEREKKKKRKEKKRKKKWKKFKLENF